MPEIIAMVRMLGQGEFDSVPNEDIEWWIDLCSMFVSKEVFGRIYEKAIALYVCHVLKMNGYGEEGTLGDTASIARDAASSGISSISDGGSSISFMGGQSMSSSSDADLGQTSYGRQFLSIRRALVVPITINH